VTEQNHETVERSNASFDAQFSDVSPVDLRLFASQRLEAGEGASRPSRSMLGDEAAEGPEASDVAAVEEHVVQARAHEARVSLEDVHHEGRVRVEQRLPRFGVLGLGTERADDTIDDVAVDAELLADGALLPVLGEVEATDLDLDGTFDGHRLTSVAGSES
jgi:hypothetical protein